MTIDGYQREGSANGGPCAVRVVNATPIFRNS